MPAKNQEQANSAEWDLAPGWLPVKDDKIDYEVLKFDLGGGQWGEYPILIVRLESEANSKEGVLKPGDEMALHVFHKVLFNALKQVRATPGMKLSTWYLGKMLPKGTLHPEADPETAKDAFHGYRVRRRDITADDVWGKMDANAFSDEAPF